MPIRNTTDNVGSADRVDCTLEVALIDALWENACDLLSGSPSLFDTLWDFLHRREGAISSRGSVILEMLESANDERWNFVSG